MANGSGGEFAGDGSVSWHVTTVNDKQSGPKGSHGSNGLKFGGADNDYGASFKVTLRVPSGATDKAKFLSQFAVAPTGGVVEIWLPIEKVSRQVKVEWSPSVQAPFTWGEEAS